MELLSFSMLFPVVIKVQSSAYDMSVIPGGVVVGFYWDIDWIGGVKLPHLEVLLSFVYGISI